MEARTAQIDAIIASGNFDSLASVLDDAELQEPSGHFPPHWPFALHLASHIYVSSLEDARFLHKRIPTEVIKVNAEVQQLFEVLQRFWTRDYQKLWVSLAFNWSSQLQPLMQALAVKLRADVMGLVSRAYSSLSPAKLGMLLGVPEQEAAQLAAAQGWGTDSVSGLIMVKHTAALSQAHATQQQLQRLAEYVVHLEA